MRRAPRDPRNPILNARAVADLAWCGLVVGAITMGNYLLFYGRHGVNPFADDMPDDVVWQATTVTYVSILLCQLVNIIQRRSIHGFFCPLPIPQRAILVGDGRRHRDHARHRLRARGGRLLPVRPARRRRLVVRPPAVR